MTDRPLLLIVEDDEPLRTRLARAFADRGYDVRAVATTSDALAAAADEAPEFVLLDLRVGADHGLDLIPKLTDLDGATRIVVLTGYGSVATAVEAIRLGAANYLTKPADVDEIIAAFDRDAPTRGQAPPLRAMSLDRVEWEHINRVLMECGGNVSEAARVLGIHRRSLQRKLSRFPAKR